MILSGEKKLMPLKDLKPVTVGFFDEISVKGLYEEFSQRTTIKPYMPPKIYKGRTVFRSYFFDIINFGL